MIVRIDPDDTATVVADDLDFPNGMVITPDGRTLIVAESTGRRLTAFAIDADGGLGDRRVFADGLDGPPDGIALDAEGGVWASMVLANQFERIVEGGTVTDRIDVGDRMAIACALGGPEGKTLFLLTSTDAYPERLVGTKSSRVDAVTVDVPAAGGFLTVRSIPESLRSCPPDSYYELVDTDGEHGEKFVATDWCAARGRPRSNTARHPRRCWCGRWSAASSARTPG